MEKDKYIIERLYVENAQLRMRILELEHEIYQAQQAQQAQLVKVQNNEEN